MNDTMLQTGPSLSPLPGELPVVDEITQEGCPEMFAELCNNKGEDDES